MFYLEKPAIFSHPLSSIGIFIFLFFFSSCQHFKKSDISDTLIEKTQIKIKEKKPAFYSLSKGLNLYKEKKWKESRDWLEKLNYGEESFASAVLEIQKINYIEQDWDRFFALAFYYKQQFLNSPETSARHFKQEMLALEILALIRHCRFPEALQTKVWSLKLAKHINKDSSKIQKTKPFFNLKSKVGDVKEEKINWEKQINLWPITLEEMNNLNNPKNLRKQVRSRC